MAEEKTDFDQIFNSCHKFRARILFERDLCLLWFDKKGLSTWELCPQCCQ